MARRLHKPVHQPRDPEDHVHDRVGVEQQHTLDLALHLPRLSAGRELAGRGIGGGAGVEFGFGHQGGYTFVMVLRLVVGWDRGKFDVAIRVVKTRVVSILLLLLSFISSRSLIVVRAIRIGKGG